MLAVDKETKAKVINFRNYVRIENSLRKNKRIGCTV